jgi:hypothetical protein
MTDAAWMEAEYIREAVQDYADQHPGMSEEEARECVLDRIALGRRHR